MAVKLKLRIRLQRLMNVSNGRRKVRLSLIPTQEVRGAFSGGFLPLEVPPAQKTYACERKLRKKKKRKTDVGWRKRRAVPLLRLRLGPSSQSLHTSLRRAVQELRPQQPPQALLRLPPGKASAPASFNARRPLRTPRLRRSRPLVST